MLQHFFWVMLHAPASICPSVSQSIPQSIHPFPVILSHVQLSIPLTACVTPQDWRRCFEQPPSGGQKKKGKEALSCLHTSYPADFSSLIRLLLFLVLIPFTFHSVFCTHWAEINCTGERKGGDHLQLFRGNLHRHHLLCDSYLAPTPTLSSDVLTQQFCWHNIYCNMSTASLFRVASLFLVGPG